MDRYKETSETWNKISSLYQDKFMELDIYNETYTIVCNSITKKNAKLLDIGCGPGNITKYLLSARPDFDILGIDSAPTMIELAKKNNPTANFAIMDMRHIDGLTTTFDGIICGFCLPYLSYDDSYKFITDCYNVLNDDGLLYISFVEGDPNKSDFQVGSTGDRVYFYFYNLNELCVQLTENHFGDLRILKIPYTRKEKNTEIHTIIIAKKNVTC